MRRKAEKDAYFAFRLSEAGFGRAPASLDIKVVGDPKRPIVHKARFEDGAELPAAGSTAGSIAPPAPPAGAHAGSAAPAELPAAAAGGHGP